MIDGSEPKNLHVPISIGESINVDETINKVSILAEEAKKILDDFNDAKKKHSTMTERASAIIGMFDSLNKEVYPQISYLLEDIEQCVNKLIRGKKDNQCEKLLNFLKQFFYFCPINDMGRLFKIINQGVMANKCDKDNIEFFYDMPVLDTFLGYPCLGKIDFPSLKTSVDKGMLKNNAEMLEDIVKNYNVYDLTRDIQCYLFLELNTYYNRETPLVKRLHINQKDHTSRMYDTVFDATGKNFYINDFLLDTGLFAIANGIHSVLSSEFKDFIIMPYGSGFDFEDPSNSRIRLLLKRKKSDFNVRFDLDFDKTFEFYDGLLLLKNSEYLKEVLKNIEVKIEENHGNDSDRTSEIIKVFPSETKDEEDPEVCRLFNLPLKEKVISTFNANAEKLKKSNSTS